jgi:hypothetical protein
MPKNPKDIEHLHINNKIYFRIKDVEYEEENTKEKLTLAEFNERIKQELEKQS